MENRDRCPHCGALILPNEKFCGQCGAPLTGATDTAGAANTGEQTPANAAVAGSSGWQPGTRPRTIEQLQDFCAYNEMPLERMRFFVGEDYKEARAFGIYGEDRRFVVYKNRSDGSRVVRYDGPDEAYAVGELYDKLLDECHRRDIWPDGKPADLEKRRKSEKRTPMTATTASKVRASTTATATTGITATTATGCGRTTYPMIITTTGPTITSATPTTAAGATATSSNPRPGRRSRRRVAPPPATIAAGIPTIPIGIRTGNHDKTGTGSKWLSF